MNITVDSKGRSDLLRAPEPKHHWDLNKVGNLRI